MKDELISKTQLRAYLLGELEETIAEQYAELCLTESDWCDALLVERDELLDDWASGNLNPVEAGKLEARFAALPALRDHAAFALSLYHYFSPSDVCSGLASGSVVASDGGDYELVPHQDDNEG